MVLFGYLIGLVVAMSSNTEPAERARNLALVCKKVYLSNDKKIVSVEFEKWGWYILNFIKRYKSDYMTNFNKAGDRVL